MTTPIIPYALIGTQAVLQIQDTTLESLAPQETELLSLLLEQPGKILSNRMLHHALHTRGDYKLIDVLICKIRRKLIKAFAPEPPPIVIDTVWGLGYYIRLKHNQPITPIHRWTPIRKRGFLAQFIALEQTALDYEIAAFRRTAPEINDHLIQEWDTHGVRAIF